MSADVCNINNNINKTERNNLQSRIPIPCENPIRRSLSLRLKGEKLHGNFRSVNSIYKLIPDSNLTTATRTTSTTTAPSLGTTRKISCENVLLRRATSFLERGEIGVDNNVTTYKTAVAYRPSNVITTEPRNQGALKGALTPTSPTTTARTRSLSLSLSNARLNSPRSPTIITSSPKTPPTSPENRRLSSYNTDWDTESITSINSGISVASSCDHASVARNGTTFSGRSMKYVVHCSQHAGVTGEDYLTPTQRAHKQLKRLKVLLQKAQNDLEQKDSDIIKLTKEVVELRLYKAALNSPEDKSNSSDAVTVRENTDEQVTPITTDHIDSNNVGNHIGMTCSYADSGHFEDFTNSSIHSKDSVHLSDDYVQSPCRRKLVETYDKCINVDLGFNNFEIEHQKLIAEYEKRIHELIKTHEEECYQQKQKHNDKVEELLQRISEINTRYWELVPDLDVARDRIKDLEHQLEEASRKLEEQEDKHKQLYLQMYSQGQEAARLEHENQVMERAQHSPSRISVPELLKQLQDTQRELDNVKDLEYQSPSNSIQPLLSAKEAVSLWVLGARKAMYKQLMEAKNKHKIDPEITLQFLKSAIYYFLTDRENSQGHLRAIQSILGFSDSEILNIDKARLN